MLDKGFDHFAKLSCQWRYGRLLSAYLDHEVNARAQEIVAGHLRKCDRCRGQFEQLRFANRALAEFEVPPMRRSPSVGQVFQLPTLREVSSAKRFYSQKIAVPLPLAAGLVIALISATFFLIGQKWRTPIESTVSVPASAVIKVVEVPVERVVTRTVYAQRSDSRRVRRTRKENGPTLTPPDSKGAIAQNADGTFEWSSSTLKDFRPASSANLRVVKEHDK